MDASVVLGIETSCDETAAAVVAATPDAMPAIRANVVWSQFAEHAAYGGVVPEIAARAHITRLDRLIAQAMAEAGCDFSDLHAIAATAGPGLIGGLMVGLMTGKAIAALRGLPFIAVNHMEAHALTARLTEGAAFPYLALLVSGGHCLLIAAEGVGRYRQYGTTIDDAVGEAFDKAAKLLGLGYPGGPAVEEIAARGDPAAFDLPRPLRGRPGCDFSFSGLKTALRHATAAAALPRQMTEQTRADLAASFQAAVADVLADRLGHAMERFAREHPEAGDMRQIVIAGGVAANRMLRARLGTVAAAHGFRLLAPPLALCGDNAAMIAWAGIERLRCGLTDGLDAPPRARWPLDPEAERQVSLAASASA
jgi:N6-L-threonylcarbamoyladenine synthase